MDCPAVLEWRGKRFPCQRPKVKVDHQRHYWKRRIAASSRAEHVLTWMQVIGGGGKGLAHVTHRCSECGDVGHNARRCPSWRLVGV